MSKCKHKGWKDYQWKHDIYGHQTDELLAIYCHTCGESLKVNV